VSLLHRSSSLDEASSHHGDAVASRCANPTMPTTPPNPAVALDEVVVGFDVSIGGLGRTELAGELDGLDAPRRHDATEEISIRLVLLASDDGASAGRSRPVRAAVELRLGGRPIGEAGRSFAVVGTLRGMLTRGGTHRHLDLADDAGPWLRCSVPETVLDRIPRRSSRGDETDLATAVRDAYVWLRPFVDWRIAGGTAAPRSLWWRRSDADAGSLGARLDGRAAGRLDDGHHAAAGS